MSHWTDKELNDCEEAVVKLSEALNIPEKGIIDILEDGFKLNHIGKPSEKILEVIDELRATFDAY